MSDHAAVGSPRGWAAGAGLAASVAAAVAVWQQILGPPVSRVVPLAAVAVLVAAGLLPRRVAVGALIACPPAALLLAGAPAAQLMPGAWRSSAARLEEGARELAAAGSAPRHDPWALAAALLLAGALWLVAAALATPTSPSGRRRTAAFVLAALPWIGALARGPAHAPVWQGALVLLGGLLWCVSSHMAARPAIALSVVVAVVSAATAQAVGPEQRWFGLPGVGDGPPPFRRLTIEPTFGPLPDRRAGRSMLEIHAREPALWRMRTLDLFDGFGWRIAPDTRPELPQPAARAVWADVRVRELRNDLAVAPGHIAGIAGAGSRGRVPGDAWRLTPPPRDGARYRVRADVVLPTADELRRAPSPTDPRLRRYTRLGMPSFLGIDVPLFGQPAEPATTRALAVTPFRSIGALARRLTAGATTEWEAVARVQHYLRDSGRFRYTTNVPPTALLPLVDFLLRRRAGYCQHFAGAAALLLRLAGVPARVAVGFATGEPKRGGGFDVRDVDAHDWIEVYFQGYGWVPFNPTPPAAPAHVAGTLDLLAPARARAADGGPPRLRTVGALLAALSLVAVPAARGRRRRGRAPRGDVLARLARRAGAHVDPSSTLSDLHAQLALRVGPRTSALAAAAERARYAPGAATSGPPPRARIVRAVVSDLGPARAALLLVLPAARDRSRRRG